MTTGGLDIDIWLRPAVDLTLSRQRGKRFPLRPCVAKTGRL